MFAWFPKLKLSSKICGQGVWRYLAILEIEMDLEQQFPKNFYDFDTKCVSIWVHHYGHQKNPKNSKKVATYQGFMRILSVFSII